MKKFLVTLLSVLILVTGVAFIAACDSCDSDKVTADFFKTYLLPQEGKPLDEDFVLDSTFKDKRLTWTSSDPDAIALTKRDKDWLAEVKLADDSKNVTLTVSVGEVKKDFNVTVMGRDVYYILDKFPFIQDKQTVAESFDLQTSYECKGATATIVWEIADEYTDYIKLNAEGNKCLVSGNSLEPEVVIQAHFTYNGITATAEYTMYASVTRTHLETIDYWYTNEGVSVEISGYVVAIDEASTTYNNATLYIIDDDFCAGYYLFRVKSDAANISLIENGVHVTVTGTTNQNYNGLVETNAGGNLVVDKDENGNVIKINDALEKVYAIDNDLLAGAPAAVYNESRMVSLDKWEVTSKPDAAPASGVTATLFTLKKGDVTVPVVVSKYLKGVYDTTKTDDAVYSALVALYNTVNVGDVISIKGILGNYKGYQIMPLAAADVTIEAAGTTASAIPELCGKVNAAITAVQGVFTKDIITESKDITVPKTVEGVTIAVELLKESTNVTLADNVISVTVGDEENISVQVTYTIGDYSTVTFHSVHHKKVTDQGTVDEVKKGLTLANELASGTELTTSESGTTIAWALKAPVEGVTLTGNKITATADKEVTLVATITLNNATATKEFKVVVKAPVAPVEDERTGTYNIVLDLTNAADKAKKYYFSGAIDGNYAGTTDDATKAGAVVVAKSGEGYTFTVDGKYLELVRSGNYANPKLLDAQTEGKVWKYDTTLNTFTWDSGDGKVWYIGSYTNSSNSTRATIGASETSYISGDNASKVGVTQFVVSFVKTDSSSTTPPTGGDTNTTHAGTEADPFTIADVKTVGKDLGNSEYYKVDGVEKEVYIKGYVVDAGAANGTNGVKNVKIADAKGDTANAVNIGSLNYSDVFSSGMLVAGDLITVKGYIEGFNGAISIYALGSNYPTVTERVEASNAEKAQAALNALNIPESVTGNIDLTSSVAGVTLTLVSDNAAIAADGTVTRPAQGASDVTVNLTVTATIGDEHPSKNVTVVVKAQMAAGATASITFTVPTSHADDKNVFSANGITLTNEKGKSTNNCFDCKTEARLYASSDCKLEYAGIVKVVFTCTSASYATALENSLKSVAGATVTKDDKTVTITFASAVESFEFTCTAQTRVSSLTIN